MKKLLLVIRREYLTRIRKKSFWILSIVVPLVLGFVYALPVIFASRQAQTTNVVVVDESTIFHGLFRSNDIAQYSYAGGFDYAYNVMRGASDSVPTVVLYIPARETTIPSDAFLYYCGVEPHGAVQHDISQQLQQLLLANVAVDVIGISEEQYQQMSSAQIRVHLQDLETGRDGYLQIKIILASILAIIIFTTIFLFGSQVMRGVMEEKTSRIVEVLLCSLKPMQLMAGKVFGIACVGITQIALWLLLLTGSIAAVQFCGGDIFSMANQQNMPIEVATKGVEATRQMQQLQDFVPVPEIMKGLVSIRFQALLWPFLFFFVFGYFLYASLFAALGALSDTETDTQQFSIPVTIPLMLSIILMPIMLEQPSGTLAVVMSLVPFTSPVSMMMRIPFGVPMWQVVLSIVLLIATIPLCTFIAARIYRSALLHNHARTTYKEIWLWLRQKIK